MATMQTTSDEYTSQTEEDTESEMSQANQDACNAVTLPLKGRPIHTITVLLVMTVTYINVINTYVILVLK